MKTAAVSMPKQGKGLRVGEAVRKYQWNKAGQSGLSSNDTPGPRKSSLLLSAFSSGGSDGGRGGLREASPHAHTDAHPWRPPTRSPGSSG